MDAQVKIMMKHKQGRRDDEPLKDEDDEQGSTMGFKLSKHSLSSLRRLKLLKPVLGTRRLYERRCDS
jgi:hypothetical protein